MKTALFFLLYFLFFPWCKAQLKLDQIMKGEGFIGALPQNPEWSIDGKLIYYWKQYPDSAQKTFYVYQTLNDQTRVLGQDEWNNRWVWNSNLAQLQNVRINNQHVELLDLKTQATKRISLFSDDFWNLQHQTDPSQVIIQRGNNLVQIDLVNGISAQVVSYQKAQNKKPKSVLAAAEVELFESISSANNVQNKGQKNRIKITDFDPSGALQLDPTGKYVILKSESEPKEVLTEVPHFIADDAYVFNQKARAKVHDDEPSEKLYLHDLKSDSLVELDYNNLSDLNSKDRALIFHPVIFSNSKPIALCDIRSADNKDRWIVLIDLISRSIIELEHQQDSAWIGGPGISSWNFQTATLGWVSDGESIFFQSEQTGFSHLYLLDLDTKNKKALTNGNFEVHEAVISKNAQSFYLTCNINHPGVRDFWILDIASQKLVPLLVDTGAYEIKLSPNEKQIAYRFSTSLKPWEIYLVEMNNLKKVKQITHSTTSAFELHDWQAPQVINFTASDGNQVYARVYKPDDKIKNGAAILFVHGAGYLQNAHHFWSQYYREYMFHQMLLDEGYTVLDVDYRASEGYGRDYRTAIYRHMGGRDLEDFLDAKNLLVSTYGIDENRIGIYGGSYGGFITLMALFTAPGEFACGAALRAVTDWAHYNHEYTSNILNTPKKDPEAYRQSSPIFFAEGLQDPLLILHGMVDDNVQFQDVVRLNQRLIELGKKNWWMALYPVERHGFIYSSSWVDEYSRIYNLFETYLK